MNKVYWMDGEGKLRLVPNFYIQSNECGWLGKPLNEQSTDIKTQPVSVKINTQTLKPKYP